jgi:hypothetical protein
MTDQNVALQRQRFDDAFGVGGKVGDAVTLVRGCGIAPAAVIGGDDSIPVGQRVCHRVPGTRRAAVVVQEYQGQLAAAPLRDVNPRTVRLDFHFRSLFLRLWGDGRFKSLA